jgi:signal transduction histidine kinase
MNDPEDSAGPLLLKLGNEVRHTLHHMLGLLDLAAAESRPKVRSSYLSQCRANADQLLRTANDVSELAFDEDAPRRGSPFRLPEMIEEVAESMRTLAAEKGLSFNCAEFSATPSSLAVAEALQCP